MEKLIVTSDVVEQTGIPRWKIERALEMYPTMKPKNRAGYIYIWAQDEVERLRRVINMRRGEKFETAMRYWIANGCPV